MQENVVRETELKELPLVKRGKGRDKYREALRLLT
jgi:hypothetical protein